MYITPSAPSSSEQEPSAATTSKYRIMHPAPTRKPRSASPPPPPPSKGFLSSFHLYQYRNIVLEFLILHVIIFLNLYLCIIKDALSSCNCAQLARGKRYDYISKTEIRPRYRLYKPGDVSGSCGWGWLAPSGFLVVSQTWFPDLAPITNTSRLPEQRRAGHTQTQKYQVTVGPHQYIFYQDEDAIYSGELPPSMLWWAGGQGPTGVVWVLAHTNVDFGC